MSTTAEKRATAETKPTSAPAAATEPAPSTQAPPLWKLLPTDTFQSDHNHLVAGTLNFEAAEPTGPAIASLRDQAAAASADLVSEVTARLDRCEGYQRYLRLREQVAAVNKAQAQAAADLEVLRARRRQLEVSAPADLAGQLLAIEQQVKDATARRDAAAEQQRVLSRPLWQAYEAAHKELAAHSRQIAQAMHDSDIQEQDAVRRDILELVGEYLDRLYILQRRRHWTLGATAWREKLIPAVQSLLGPAPAAVPDEPAPQAAPPSGETQGMVFTSYSGGVAAGPSMTHTPGR